MIKHQLAIGFGAYILGIISDIGISSNSKSDVITFLSIIIGFFLSAIAILYASPLRKLLHGEKAKSSANKWLNIIEVYKNVTIYSFSVILYLLVDFPYFPWMKVTILKYNIFEYEKFILALVIVAVYDLIRLLLILFNNLKVPVND